VINLSKKLFPPIYLLIRVGKYAVTLLVAPNINQSLPIKPKVKAKIDKADHRTNRPRLTSQEEPCRCQ